MHYEQLLRLKTMFWLFLLVALAPVTSVHCVKTLLLSNETTNYTAYIPNMEEVQLQCTVSSAILSRLQSGIGFINWMRNGESVCKLTMPLNRYSDRCQPGSKLFLTLTKEAKYNLRNGFAFNVTFIIRRFTNTDIGNYSFSVEDSIVGPVRLTLLQYPSAENPVCSMVSQAKRFQTGSDILFSCKLPGGSPLPALSWYRTLSDGATSPLGDGVTVLANDHSVSHTLSPEDNGAIFICRALHPTYTSSHNCSLGPIIVYYSPIANLTVGYLYQSSINLTVISLTCLCRSSSNPLVTKYSWTIKNLDVISMHTDSDKQSLLYIDVRSDSGSASTTEESVPSVECQATNSIGVGKSNVQINLARFLNDTNVDLTPRPARMHPLSLLGPVSGAFFAGVCFPLIIFAMVFLSRRRVYLNPGQRGQYRDTTTSAVTTHPYSIGYVDGRAVLQMNNENEGAKVQPVYEDMEDQTIRASQETENNAPYTDLLHENNSDEYENLDPTRLQDSNEDENYEDPV